jgi:hypothetical protein
MRRRRQSGACLRAFLAKFEGTEWVLDEAHDAHAGNVALTEGRLVPDLVDG